MQKTITFSDPNFRKFLDGEINGKQSETWVKVHLIVHSWLVENINKLNKNFSLSFMGNIDEKFLSKYGLIHRRFTNPNNTKQLHKLEKNGVQFGDALEIEYLANGDQITLNYRNIQNIELTKKPQDITIIEA